MTKNKSITSKKPMINATIVNAVRDQDGNQHYCFESPIGKIWINLTEFRADENTAYNKLQKIGVTILTTAPKNEFKRLVEAVTEFSEALVATQPGFVSPTIYVHPNGDITHADDCNVTPIVSFTEDNRYRTSGSFKEWKMGLSACIEDNPVCGFLLCYGFLPFLLKLSPLKHNPTVEIISPPEFGKSGACAVAASIFGGDPESDNGLGISWHMTKNAFSMFRLIASDGLFYVDESNMQGEDIKQDGLIAFMQASTGNKGRQPDGPVVAKPIWTALLSNGNELPEQRFNGPKNTIKAAESRRITIALDEPVFSVEDWKKLRGHVDKHFGWASRRFVKRVVNACSDDEEQFKQRIINMMFEFSSQVGKDAASSQRVLDVCALAYTAGELAKEWKILPKKSMDPTEAVEQIYARITSEDKARKPRSAEQRIRTIIKEHKLRIRRCRKSGRPNKATDKSNLLAYTLKRGDGGRTLYFHAEKLREALGTDSRSVLRGLRDEGILIGENGKSPKLTSHAPRYVGFSGRIFKLVMPVPKK